LLGDMTVPIDTATGAAVCGCEPRRLFPRLRAAGSDLGTLGARMSKRKGELMAEMLEVEE